MADIARLRIDLSGTAVVGASVMTLYQDAAATTGLPADVMTFLNAIKANFPPGLTYTVPGGGDLLNVATGALTGTWSEGGGGTVTGTGVGGYAIGVGGLINWGTSGIVSGRRVRGRTFLVPLMGGSFDSSGRMQPATVTALNTPLATFLTNVSPALVIWSRPTSTRAGSMHPVTTANIPATPSTLRSRRT